MYIHSCELSHGFFSELCRHILTNLYVSVLGHFALVNLYNWIYSSWWTYACTL